MATDQVAVLAIRAAARGAIDFSKARLRDVSWYRHVRVLIGAMRTDDDLRNLELRLLFHSGLVGNSNLTEQSFKEVQKTAHELVHNGRNTLYPWAAVTLEEVKKNEQNVLIDAYRNMVGDTRDPAFMEALRAEIAASAEERLKPQPLDDMDKIFAAARAREQGMRTAAKGKGLPSTRTH